MSDAASSQKAVNYLERRADFSALDAMVSTRRGLAALRMNADSALPSLAPIKVKDKKYSSSYCVGACSSALASGSTMSYSSGRAQASKFDAEWFRIGSSPKHNGSSSSKTKKKSHSKNKDSSTVPRDKKTMQSKDKELSANGERRKSSKKIKKIDMHENKEISTSKRGTTSSGSNEAILKHSEAAVRRRLETKVSRDRETRSVRKARLRSMVRSMQFSSREDFDPDLLEHTDDEERIYHYPYRTNTESQFEIANPPASKIRRPHTIPHTSQPTQHRQSNAQTGARSAVRVKPGRTNYRSCKRSLLRWMAHTMCKQPLAKHY